ncbi:Hypothetical predicted protein [Xyrichtys novacula]|uniref:Uncharacterized protein n=1 Tax=Xyrichtys novacula TaxID=13765 RepID=A0AAV1F2Q0_XYRNO|nr:Hypothetical predicted protein [Xyrichtys novacula]
MSATVALGKERVMALEKWIPRAMLSPTIKVVGGNSGGGCMASVTEAGLVTGLRGLGGAMDAYYYYFY